MINNDEKPGPDNEPEDTPEPETKSEKGKDETGGDPPSEVRHFKPAKPNKG